MVLDLIVDELDEIADYNYHSEIRKEISAIRRAILPSPSPLSDTEKGKKSEE